MNGPAVGEPGRLIRPGRLLPRAFFAREVATVAADLLGRMIVAPTPQGDVVLRLTEVEAYAGPSDPASHAFRRTSRSEIMYGPPGFLYVYFIYGMHWCANVVVGPVGEAAAVLLRSAEVVEGVDAARVRRPTARRDLDLARGPAAVTQVLGLTGANSGSDLLSPGRPIQLRSGAPAGRITAGPRVGVSVAAEVPWRFVDADSAAVTSYRAGGKRRR